jgi:hypothetical protein
MKSSLRPNEIRQSAIGNWQSFHSYLSAFNGSTLDARRAGMKQAKSATSKSNIETPKKVIGSLAPTPINKLDNTRVNRNAPINPVANPTITSSIP